MTTSMIGTNSFTNPFAITLHSDGLTEYVWRSMDYSRLKIESCGDNKGLGVYNGLSDTSIPKSSIIFSNKESVAKYIQHRRARTNKQFCFNCLHEISPSALSFSHPQCRYFLCCSHNCLSILEPMIVTIAPAVNAIINNLECDKIKVSQPNYQPNSNLAIETIDEETDKQSSIMLLQWLYYLTFQTGRPDNISQLRVARQCLNLFNDLDSIRSRYLTLAENLLQLFQNVLPIQLMDRLESFCASLSSSSMVISTPVSVLAQMLRIIHLNAQPMHPYSTSSDLTFLFLLPTIPRLNHSCNPNAALVLEKTKKDGHPQVSVLALRDIKSGEEVTISYLEDLCLPVLDRRNLLSQAFGFICQCTRCVSESNTIDRQPVPKTKSKLLLKLQMLENQLNQYFETEKSHLSSPRSLVYIEQRELLSTAQCVFDLIVERKKSMGTNDEFSLEKLANPCTEEEVRLCMSIPSLLRDAAGVILQQYTERFQYLQQEQQQVSMLLQTPGHNLSAKEAITLVLESKGKLIHYGWWFLRSGQYVALAYELAHIPSGKTQLKRLELMVMTSMYGAVTARAYVETFRHVEQLSHGISCDNGATREQYVQGVFANALPSPRELLEALRGGISMAIDVQLVIKTVYLTAQNATHRDQLGHGTQEATGAKKSKTDSESSLDVWTYLEDLHVRACKAKKYCQTVFEQVGTLHDRFST